MTGKYTYLGPPDPFYKQGHKYLLTITQRNFLWFHWVTIQNQRGRPYNANHGSLRRYHDMGEFRSVWRKCV